MLSFIPIHEPLINRATRPKANKKAKNNTDYTD
jgi:hypothetical protein